MKLVRVIMIKLLWNIYTCVYTYGLELFVWIFTCMLSRQTLKLGNLDITYVFSGEVETLSCYLSDAIIMKFLSEQFVLKLCQIDNLCQSWGKLKLLLMNINFTFSGGQKLRTLGRSWNFLRSQFWYLEQFFWNFVRIIICKKSPQYIWLLCISKLLIVWCRYNQVIRVMSKKLPTLQRGSLSIKCLNLSRDSSMPRQNKTRDKVGIDCILWRVRNFVMSLVWL